MEFIVAFVALFPALVLGKMAASSGFGIVTQASCFVSQWRAMRQHEIARRAVVKKAISEIRNVKR